MQVQIQRIQGTWDDGYALHKHTLSSVFLGQDEYGHDRFDTTRSEPGEALYLLKYKGDWEQVKPLAAQLETSLWPLFPETIGLIVPMPASTVRARQPVVEIANELGRRTGTPVINNMIAAAPPPPGSPPLKNLTSRAEKDAALQGRFSISPNAITNEGCWNALLLDDLFHTGATMDAVCKVLRTYDKIGRVYAAAITWR